MDGLAHITARTLGAVPAPPVVAMLGGLNNSQRVVALFNDPRLRTRALLRLEPECGPPCPATVWRLETGWGEPLNGKQALRAAWQRPPYALTVRLVHYAAGGVKPTVLDEGTIGTRLPWPAYSDAAEQLALRLVCDVAAGRPRGPSAMPATPKPRRDGMPGWVRDQAHQWKARLLDEWWSLGVASAGMEDVLEHGHLGPVTWFEPEPHPTYLADPFPWPGTDRILCEEMPRHGGPGRIVAVERENDDLLRRASILADGQHHSYPATFQRGGFVYCVPESVERGMTRIYELQPDEGLRLICSPAPDRRLADPTLFWADGRFWLACTDLDIGSADNLCLLHAPDLTGPWQEHAKWPVRIDVRGARPAGAIIEHRGRLIRPGQDCAATYGAAVALHEIEVLTPDDFSETLLMVPRPDPAGPFPHGMHTLVHDGERFWLDGKRFIFDPSILARKVLRRVRRSSAVAVS